MYFACVNAEASFHVFVCLYLRENCVCAHLLCRGICTVPIYRHIERRSAVPAGRAPSQCQGIHGGHSSGCLQSRSSPKSQGGALKCGRICPGRVRMWARIGGGSAPNGAIGTVSRPIRALWGQPHFWAIHPRTSAPFFLPPSTSSGSSEGLAPSMPSTGPGRCCACMLVDPCVLLHTRTSTVPCSLAPRS